MSRVGKKPVVMPAGVSAAMHSSAIVIKGPKGELKQAIPEDIKIDINAQEIEVSRKADTPFACAMHGTIRSLINNMVTGVSEGYTRELEIQGVGFKAAVQGDKLNLALGYSHPINFEIPAGITIKVNDNTNVVVTGADKQMVGQVSTRIKSFYPAEPYKGKGVRFKGEHIRRKAGKAAA